MTFAILQTCKAAELRASLAALDNVTHETAHMKLLAWIMGLPHDLDPAIAARLVLGQSVDGAATTKQDGISSALLRLVEAVAEYPRERLALMARRRTALN